MDATPSAKPYATIEQLDALLAFHRELAPKACMDLSDFQVVSVWTKALRQCGFEASMEQRFLNVGTPTDHCLIALATGPHRLGRQGHKGWPAIVQAHGCMPMQPDKFYWHATAPEPVPEHAMGNTGMIAPSDHEALVTRYAAFIQGWSLEKDTDPVASPMLQRARL